MCLEPGTVYRYVRTRISVGDTEKMLHAERGLVTDDTRAASNEDEPPHRRDDVAHDIDYRAHPERYEIGRGEEGVFKVQPYKSELLPHWGYADRDTADESGAAIYRQFRRYKRADDFVGMDMARKYLQMGYTRAMRYARYPGGRKYEDGDERDPIRWADTDKRDAALVYDAWLTLVRNDDRYQELESRHRERNE